MLETSLERIRNIFHAQKSTILKCSQLLAHKCKVKQYQYRAEAIITEEPGEHFTLKCEAEEHPYAARNSLEHECTLARKTESQMVSIRSNDTAAEWNHVVYGCSQVLFEIQFAGLVEFSV